jgi:hypothetical protein
VFRYQITANADKIARKLPVQLQGGAEPAVVLDAGAGLSGRFPTLRRRPSLSATVMIRPRRTLPAI